MAITALGIGLSIWDTLIALHGYPEEDGKLPVAQVTAQGGGPTATALVTMARLGLPAGYMGALGDDGPGDNMAAEFERYGVDTRFLARVPGAPSPIAFVLVNRIAKTRTILHYTGGMPGFELTDVCVEALRACRLLHLEGRGEIDVQAAQIARNAGGIVSLDAGTVRPVTERVMALTDLIIMSESFLSQFTGIENPEDALAAVDGRFSPKVCAVTQGASGGLWRQSGVTALYPAFPVDVADTTGAGDVFHGAFAYGYLQGWPVGEICRFASAAAAIKCTRAGGRAGIPSLHEIEAFLAEDAIVSIEKGRYAP